EKVAIVGATGAGKSTLVSLIPRFYDPIEGEVRIDGEDIRNYTLQSLREQISLVLQDQLLFSGTVRENIAFGCPRASDEEIVAAAVAANADEFIQQLPDGYETLVAERSTTLSGGQKQGKVGRGILTKEKLLANTEAAPIEPDALAFDPSLPGMALLHQPMRLLETLSHVLAEWLGPHANLLDSRVAIRRIVPGQPRNNKITFVASIGLALLVGATIVEADRAPTGTVMHVAAVGDIHDEGASSVAAATSAEAAKADFILGLGDYQYDDGAMG